MPTTESVTDNLTRAVTRYGAGEAYVEARAALPEIDVQTPSDAETASGPQERQDR